MPQGHVLVVEDDDAVRHLLVEVLKEDAALRVDSARDGVDALHRVSTKQYDLVILDVMMPHMTGIDFLDSLQALTSDPSVKNLQELPAVVVVTSATPEQIPNGKIEERFPSMVRGVLRKPLRTDELRACVERALA
ncbi:MAG: response regulator [Thermoanaerobaculia bacterium]